jgi:cell division protein FtsQ
LRLLLVTLAVLGVVAGVGWLVYFAPAFRITRVDVVGARQVLPSEVVAAARVPMRMPLARLDVGAVRARISQLAPVAAVQVQRRLPHTVRLVLQERVAAAVVATPRGYQLVDIQGVAFASVPRPPARLPLLRSTSAAGAPLAVAETVAVLRALPPAIRGRVQSVTASSPSDVALALRGGLQVIWGGPDQGAAKAVVLGALLHQRAHVYDVSIPSVPVTR